MIKRLRLWYSTPFLYRVLNVSASGYYLWLNRKPSNHAQEDGRLEVEIQAAHKRTRQTCESITSVIIENSGLQS